MGLNYILIHLGSLKFDKNKAISILRNELKCYGNNFSYKEIIEYLNNIIIGSHTNFTYIEKYCLDKIFEGNEYSKIEDDFYN